MSNVKKFRVNGQTYDIDVNAAATVAACEEATSAATAATAAANTAAANASHVPYIDSETGTWWEWDSTEGEYVDTEVSADADATKADKTYVDAELDKRANKDGYYSTLTAGAAENLVGQNADPATWEERPVGGEGAEVATGLASVQAIGGNGLAWNQLVENPNMEGATYYEACAYGDILTTENNVITATNENGTAYFGVKQLVPKIAGHKYYIKLFGKASEPMSVYNIYADGCTRLTGNSSYDFVQSEVWHKFAELFESTLTDPYGVALRKRGGDLGHEASLSMKKLVVIDLSLIFGIGNEPATVAEAEAWLAANIGTKPYYPYNAGTLLPAKLQAYKTTGKSANLLNPATRTARLFAYTWPDHNNMFTIKELPSGLTLTFTPDATGVAETITPDSNGHFSVSGSGNLVVSGSADLSATWLIATWDESMDDYDNFEAWDGKEYAFDTSKVYGKLNGAGDYVQVFPDGMRATPTDKDIIDLESSSADVNVGKYTWTGQEHWHNEYNTLWVKVTNFCKAAERSLVRSIVANRIPSGINQSSVGTASQGVMNYNNSGDYMSAGLSNEYATGYDFEAYLAQLYANGTPLEHFYPLATPKHYTDCVYRDNGVDIPLSKLNIIVNNWAYEQAVVSAPDNNGQPTSCAAQSTILYGIDAVEQLDTLKETGITVADLGNNLRALAAVIGPVMGGTLTVNDPSSGKTFGFSFTPSETSAES